MAPTGAARLKMKRFDRTRSWDMCSRRRTEVRPKAAGALCSIIARKTIGEGWIQNKKSVFT